MNSHPYEKHHDLGRAAMIGKFQPPHTDWVFYHAARNSDELLFLISGFNRRRGAFYPFSGTEVRDMIGVIMDDYGLANYSTHLLADFGHLRQEYADGRKWAEMTAQRIGMLGGIDTLITGNEHTRRLLRERIDCSFIDPDSLVPPEKRNGVNSTLLRMLMATRQNLSGYLNPALIRHMEERFLYRWTDMFSGQIRETHLSRMTETEKITYRAQQNLNRH
jgi:hypothetical protein